MTERPPRHLKRLGTAQLPSHEPERRPVEQPPFRQSGSHHHVDR
jgi:hypothetical protein